MRELRRSEPSPTPRAGSHEEDEPPPLVAVAVGLVLLVGLAATASVSLQSRLVLLGLLVGPGTAMTFPQLGWKITRRQILPVFLTWTYRWLRLLILVAFGVLRVVAVTLALVVGSLLEEASSSVTPRASHRPRKQEQRGCSDFACRGGMVPCPRNCVNGRVSKGWLSDVTCSRCKGWGEVRCRKCRR